MSNAWFTIVLYNCLTKTWPTFLFCWCWVDNKVCQYSFFIDWFDSCFYLIDNCFMKMLLIVGKETCETPDISGGGWKCSNLCGDNWATLKERSLVLIKEAFLNCNSGLGKPSSNKTDVFIHCINGPWPPPSIYTIMLPIFLKDW